MTREELAGLLSTLDFRPAGNHPQDCLPMADAILAALPVPPAGTREAVAWLYAPHALPDCTCGLTDGMMHDGDCAREIAFMKAVGAECDARRHAVNHILATMPDADRDVVEYAVQEGFASGARFVPAALPVPREGITRQYVATKAENLLLGLHKIVADLGPYFDKPLTETSMPRWLALDSAQKAVAEYFAAVPREGEAVAPVCPSCGRKGVWSGSDWWCRNEHCSVASLTASEGSHGVR